MWPFNTIFVDTMNDNVSNVVECLTRDREVSGSSLTGLK